MINNINDYDLIDIESIEECGWDNTYDIEVDCVHLFNARNDKSKLASISHNSATSIVFDKNDDDIATSKTYQSVSRVYAFTHTDTKITNGFESKIYEGYVLYKGEKVNITIEEWELEKLQNEKLINWWHVEPQRARSNNSVLLLRENTTHEEFKAIVERTKQFGEPGFVWADHPHTLFNPCFHKDTRIATDKGLRKIYDMFMDGDENNVVIDNRIGVGNDLDIKQTGTSIKNATPVALTQKSAKIYKLVTDHGHELKVTETHEFPTLDGRKQLKDLQIGEKIFLQSGEGSFGTMGNYSQGLVIGMITGDGTFAPGRATISIWEDDFDCANDIRSHVLNAIKDVKNVPNQTIMEPDWRYGTQGQSKKQHMHISSSLIYKMIQDLNIEDPKTIKENIPECVWMGNREFVIGYLQGLFFADGTVSLSGKNKNSTLSLQLKQSNKSILSGVQILLQNFGITSRLYKIQEDGTVSSLPNGRGGYQDYVCKASYRLDINRFNLINLIDSIGLYGRKLDRSKYLLEQRGYDCYKKEHYMTRVKSIEYDCTDDVYCLTQPETNTVIANGLAVAQCFEISFIPVTEDGICGVQFCNLTSINGRLVKSKEDFLDAVKAETIIGTLQAGYTKFDYLGHVSEELTKEEALLGCSITGMMDSPDILLNADIQKEGANYAIEINKIWAEKLGINTAARISTIKPEGTTSLFLGTASGIHPHHAKPKYFRRVQCNKIDNVYKFFKRHNKHMCEESVWSANKTDDVITFPIEVDDNVLSKEGLTAIAHLRLIKRTQMNWVIPGSVNSKKPLAHNVSCTVIVKDDEWDDVIDYIYKNKKYFTAVSLLPASGDKIYPQAPMEKVLPEDEERWNNIVNNYKPVDYTQLIEKDDKTALREEVACAGGNCEVITI